MSTQEDPPRKISCEGAIAPASSSAQNLPYEKNPEETHENNTEYLYEITCIHNTKQIIKKHINAIKNAHNIKNPLNPNSFMKQLIQALREI
jgi:hypothetical protein